MKFIGSSVAFLYLSNVERVSGVNFIVHEVFCEGCDSGYQVTQADSTP